MVEPTPTDRNDIKKTEIDEDRITDASPIQTSNPMIV